MTDKLKTKCISGEQPNLPATKSTWKSASFNYVSQFKFIINLCHEIESQFLLIIRLYVCLKNDSTIILWLCGFSNEK